MQKIKPIILCMFSPDYYSHLGNRERDEDETAARPQSDNTPHRHLSEIQTVWLFQVDISPADGLKPLIYKTELLYVHSSSTQLTHITHNIHTSIPKWFF